MSFLKQDALLVTIVHRTVYSPLLIFPMHIRRSMCTAGPRVYEPQVWRLATSKSTILQPYSRESDRRIARLRRSQCDVG